MVLGIIQPSRLVDAKKIGGTGNFLGGSLNLAVNGYTITANTLVSITRIGADVGAGIPYYILNVAGNEIQFRSTNTLDNGQFNYVIWGEK